MVDCLHDLWVRHGVHVTGQTTHRFEGSEGSEEMTQIMNQVRDNPPKTIGVVDINKVIDFSQEGSGLPPTDAVAFEAGEVRVIVRPSGTEPLIKIYAEAVVAVKEENVANSKEAASKKLEEALECLENLVKG